MLLAGSAIPALEGVFGDDIEASSCLLLPATAELVVAADWVVVKWRGGGFEAGEAELALL